MSPLKTFDKKIDFKQDDVNYIKGLFKGKRDAENRKRILR